MQALFSGLVVNTHHFNGISGGAPSVGESNDYEINVLKVGEARVSSGWSLNAFHSFADIDAFLVGRCRSGDCQILGGYLCARQDSWNFPIHCVFIAIRGVDRCSLRGSIHSGHGCFLRSNVRSGETECYTALAGLMLGGLMVSDTANVRWLL